MKGYSVPILAVTLLLSACGNDESSPSAQDCNNLAHGESENRTRYFSPQASHCDAQIQTRSCNDGAMSEWSGSYRYTSCEEGSDSELALFDISQLAYQGGFRLSSRTAGEGEYSSLNYAPGPIAYNPSNHSLFIVGHVYEQSIAEFAIPEITDSRDINDFAVGSTILQEFADFHGTDRVNTGIDDYFKVTGLALIDEQLVVNYFNWYDANGSETDTSVVFKDAQNLASSPMTGPFQLQGAAHAAGWLTDIPDYWQTALGGSHIAGHSHGSIVSRLSVGPSGFIVNPHEALLQADHGTVASTPVLDFSLENMLYKQDVYGEDYSGPTDVILYNHDRQNDLWTINSGAAYGFIIPETNTYMTIGMSAGHESGLGYKITQNNGHLCGGPCAYDAEDKYNYYWLWRVSDLVKVKAGELEPYQLRPYQYGQLDTPSKAPLLGASYDAQNKQLYVALKEGDVVGTYSRPPLFLVYQLRL